MSFQVPSKAKPGDRIISMTEPAEQTRHPQTSGNPSGAGPLEHLRVSDRAGPDRGRGGPQRDQERQQQAGNRAHISADALWQLPGARRGFWSVQLHQTPDDNCDPRKKRDEDVTLKETLKQLEALLIDSDTGVDARPGRKRHRCRTSRRRRNWKLYNKLSWEETKALEDRETARSSRTREMFSKGPLAPHNTTQFLMDEHNREEPDLNTETGVGAPMEDTGSKEDLFDNQGFLQRDFSEAYEMHHVESLRSMSKRELVQEYLELERRMSRLEEENNRLRRTVEPRYLRGGLPGPGPAPGDGETEPKPRSCLPDGGRSLPTK